MIRTTYILFLINVAFFGLFILVLEGYLFESWFTRYLPLMYMPMLVLIWQFTKFAIQRKTKCVDPLRKGTFVKVLNYIGLALLLTGILLFEIKSFYAIYVYLTFALIYFISLVFSFFGIRK